MAHPIDSSSLFPCPFYYSTTLQRYRLPNVRSFVFSQSEPNFTSFICHVRKRCMLVSLILYADFSRGYALSRIRPEFLLTHPHRLTIRGSLHAGTVSI